MMSGPDWQIVTVHAQLMRFLRNHGLDVLLSMSCLGVGTVHLTHGQHQHGLMLYLAAALVVAVRMNVAREPEDGPDQRR